MNLKERVIAVRAEARTSGANSARQFIWCTKIAVAMLIAASGISQSAVKDPVPPAVDEAMTQKFISWARHHVISIGDLALPPGSEETEALQNLVGDARVLLLGEPTHCTVEPVAVRNRLFRHLIEHQEFTAIALETGITQARAIDEFISTGIGDVRSIVLKQLTWGFGKCAGNLELIEWLRDYNAVSGHRKIHFYGIDMPGGDAAGGMSRAHEVLDAIATSLRARSDTAATIADVISKFSSQFTPEGYRSLGNAKRKELDSALDQAEDQLRSAWHKSGTAKSAWELRNVDAARGIIAMYSVWPSDFKPGGPVPSGLWRVDQIRDRAMSDNVDWALKREGSNGRLLVFAHDGHVENAHAMLLRGNFYPKLPDVMGQLLRVKFGPAVCIIGISAGKNGPGLPQRIEPMGSIEATLDRVGVAPSLINLHDAPAWAFARQTMNNAFTRTVVLIPRRAFDGLVYVDLLHQGWSEAPQSVQP